MRTIVITGATSGFGKGMVREFLANGDRVIATGRRLTSRREVLQAERAAAGNRLLEVNLDVTSAEERRAFVEFCRHELGGRIDVLVNNAAYGLYGALEDASEDEIRAQYEVNVFGLIFVTRDLLPFLRATRGKIFQVASVLGFISLPLTSLYCSTKWAVEGLTEALYHELRPHGVQVCLIEPGAYQTGFTASTQWTTGKPDSVYRQQEENYRTWRRNQNNGWSLNNPASVPRGIRKLSNRRRLPLRVPFGKDANFSAWTRRLLPSRLFLFLMSLVVRTKIG